MGKINKTAGKKHEATVSPALTEFIQEATTLKLCALQTHLTTLPPLWPFPRGDLYHWIPLLNRFDDILAQFITLYSLDQPQQRRFGSELLRADDDGREASLESKDGKDGNDGNEEDRELIESLLSFTIILLQNCGNRSLYASSDRLNDLLNTTSLSLLKTSLQVSHLLARRYFSSRQRMSIASHHSLLLSHYNITLDKVRRLAAPFAQPSTTPRQPPTASTKGKEKTGRSSRASGAGAADGKVLGSDIVTMVKGTDVDDSVWSQWSEVAFSFYRSAKPSDSKDDYPDVPDTPSPSVRRTSNLAPFPSGSDASPKAKASSTIVSPSAGAEIIFDDFVSGMRSEDVVHAMLTEHDIPQESQYELLHKIRISEAFMSGPSGRIDIVSIRLLAIANLAYVEPETKFQEKIAQPDSEEPRRLQLAYQLAELVHPPDEGGPVVPMELQTLALATLEALTKQKSRTMDVYTALSATVNHGILFYVVRKGVAQLSVDDDALNMVEENWREALFSLLSSLPTAIPRSGDQMMAAGLMDILVEILGLRTIKAGRNQWKVLTFLDNFIYSVRDGYQSLANAKGLDAIKELTGWTISNSYALAKAGKGMPEEYKTQNTDYQIPFYQQLTLRWLCKFINHLMTHNGGNFGRQLRNLIDSPEILDGLKQIISGADLFGANVWSGAVNIFSTFIHNEPTSYSVIAESRLGETFLEAITKQPLTSDTGEGKTAVDDEKTTSAVARGILPIHEAITVIPHALGALCLNEAGMKLVQESNALDCFFKIFESPIHVKAMEGKESDMDLASEMGRAFEELVRHQPTLNTEILDAVQSMVERVGRLCKDKAINDGYGAKLWVTGPGGKLFVAGGRSALAGRIIQVNDSDVNMLSRESTRENASANVSVDEIEAKMSQQEPSPTSYLSVAARFLGAFLANSTMCASFIDKGGLEHALDLATLPCLPYSFEATHCISLYEDLASLVKLLIDQKPHIALPATIKRVEATLEDLQPLLEHKSQSAFFSPFTSPSAEATQDSSAVLSNGTSYAKALVVVNVLCGALSVAFGQHNFSPRAPTPLFSQVNLTDVYVRLIDGLGKLHKSCLWEETLLIENMPATWDNKTKVSGIGFGGTEADSILGIVPSFGAEHPESLAPSESGTGEVSALAKDDTPESDTMQFNNTRIIRNLLCQAPISISSFFQLLGRQLLSRRSEPYLRQNAYKVADQLVAWMLEELQFELPRGALARYRYSYWIVILTSMTQLMIDDGLERQQPQLLTVIVASFKKQNGFAAIDSILEIFFTEAKKLIASSEETPKTDSAALLNLAMGGIKIILEFYSRVISSRYVVDTQQTQAMNPRSTERDRFEIFVPGQFLVELRKAVIQPARKMWGESESTFMDKATTSIVKSLIEILRIELEGEHETGAIKRADRVPRQRKFEPIKWICKNEDVLKRLSDEYGRDLAMEAMFRCYEQVSSAREYCQAQKDHPRSSRTPIPSNEIGSASQSSRSSPNRPVTRDQSTSSVSPAEILRRAAESLGADGDLMDEYPVPGHAQTLATREHNIETARDVVDMFANALNQARDASASGSPAPLPLSMPPPAPEDRVEAGELPNIVTVEDLDKDRSALRETLIDRCLDILNVHDDVTFELSDLISAAVSSKASSNSSLRSDIASTLLLSLTSLLMGEDFDGEEVRALNKKIASYAHLMALVLQDKDFYNVIQEELSENFNTLVLFIKHAPTQKMQDASSFIGQILLILERLLTDDAMPEAIEYTVPQVDDVVDESKPLLEMKPGFLPDRDKTALFEAILEVLPHVGKDESLALSVSRILVILTRRRTLALRLGEKPNIRRLFSMVKQLHGATNDRLQSAFLLILRHIIEDDEILRNVMRSEIVALLEDPRRARNLDTATFTRQLPHLAIRNPQIFVEVTNEVATIFPFEPKNTHQGLILKKNVPAEATSTTVENGVAEADKTAEVATTEGKEKVDVEKVKSHDLKMPIVENSDGVIHFILGELLSYKEVDDVEPLAPPLTKAKGTNSASDVEMANGQASSSTSTPPQTANGDLTKKSKEYEFKPEEHTIYIYRCFLLQCLTELLSCYNRTKVEFINFKRKADPQGTTPSKPRSFVLNYLLNTLIPTGSLAHPDGVAARKRHHTSSWAMSVVVSLCSKTGEGGSSRDRFDGKDYKEEPELLFVRKFTLEHAIRTFREAQSNSSEGLEQKYSRLLNLADLFNRMLTGKPNAGTTVNSNVSLEMLQESQRMLAKIMYEKNFISSLTSSIADIDLNFPGAKRAVKYILRPLQYLTRSANTLSLLSDNPIAPGSVDEDDISSDSSVSDINDTREETPDLFRNSALGILDPGREDDTDSESDDDAEDEEMYEDEYDDEMDYEEEVAAHEHANALNDVISDDEQDMGEMGPLEGLPGDVGMEIEVELGGEDGDDLSVSDDDSDDMVEDDEDLEDEDEMADLEDLEEGEEGSLGADEEGWGTDEGDEEEGYPGQDEIEDDDDQNMGMLNMGGGLDMVQIPQAILQGLGDPGNFGVEHLEMQEEDEEEEEEEEDYDQDEFAFEPEMDADDEEIDVRGMPWGWEGDPRAHHQHHHHGHGHQWGMFREPRRENVFPTYRSHRPVAGQRANDDGTNPLLQRQGRPGPPPTGRRRIGVEESFSDWVTAIDPMRPGSFLSPNDGPVSFINNLLNAMTQQPGGGPLRHHLPGQTLHLHIGAGMPFPGGALPRELESMLRLSRERRGQDAGMRSVRDEQESIHFIPTPTTTRWQEETRLLYGQNPHSQASRVINSILQLMVPAAIKAYKQRAKEEVERKERKRIEAEAAAKAKEEAEKKEREEREAKEKKEAEEREAALAEAAAARAQETEAEADAPAEPVPETDQMEGVETSEPTEAPSPPEASPLEPVPRVTTMIRGREVDITHLGIDIGYLEALPEEFREEVLMQQIHQQRSEAAASGEPSEISPEFLEALPDDIRNELLQQEALERRRHEREEARRRATANGGVSAQPEEIDPASFFATLDPNLRASLLMESEEDVLQSLPPEMQAEARALAGHRRLEHYVDMDISRGGRGRGLDRGDQAGEQEEKRKPTQYVQILDKAGVATLLRLMFIPQQGSAKQSLNGILRDVCQNKQNRAEVVSILLSILQDGSNDISAVERSFAHLTLRAKQPAAQKTPQPKRATPELPGTGDMSPLMVVQQCLNTLEFLTTYNPRIAEFFLTEHETGAGFKPRSARKGKGKETKASKYPLNALLGLLDRKLVIESSPVMEQLASLLQRITHPLIILLKKDKKEEKAAEELKADEAAQTVSGAITDAPAPEPVAPTTSDVEMTAAPIEPASEQPPVTAATEVVEGRTEAKATEKPADASEDKIKKHRALTPPEVPEYNLRLIINIIAARECPSKTFKDTLSLITNLSTIPEAKEIFGKELIKQAQDLGNNILRDLEELSIQISKATTGTDVQGMALARFSPASSDQAKLLRVITALDFLFDPKRSDTVDKAATSNIEGLESEQKEDILTTLYENTTFGSLWNRLSESLTAIRKRGNMFNVANILLPLIEVLMVVCKNTTLKDVTVKSTAKDFALASPEPEGREARMENLFFTFTEEHRKVLNDLVRHNPKLMSGSFSLLVKNSKVLEFDNKRNFFNRKLHTRTEMRQPHPSLQLQVRRSQVFLDSFKSLYYKKPDEFKYGKLSIRFSGEEGVDAGGVTREWFQVLTKQMFDPNYALFNPVASDRTTFHPNPLSGVNEQHLTFYKFIGRVIGKALYEGRVLDCHFSRAVYKRILGRAISVKDMESLDLEYYKSLLWILENDITDIITETFCVETEAFGETKTVDLMENGRNIPVTQQNKADYVRLVVEHKMIGSVKEQLEHFLQGFHDIVPAELIAIFNEQELELLISGLPDIDVDDWKNNTEYHNYQASSPQIQWFWRAVRSFDKEERAKLLQFVTGTSKVPLNGFKELEGMNGFSKFNIHRDYGAKERLPSSHTCFNQLDLPEYETYEDLRKALYTAMTAGGEYFGFA